MGLQGPAAAGGITGSNVGAALSRQITAANGVVQKADGADATQTSTRSVMEAVLSQNGDVAKNVMPATMLTFQRHESSDRWMAVVVDSRTGDVVRTMPPEELLDAIGRVKEMLGLVLDDWV